MLSKETLGVGKNYAPNKSIAIKELDGSQKGVRGARVTACIDAQLLLLSISC